MKIRAIIFIGLTLLLPTAVGAITDAEYYERLAEISPDKDASERYRLYKLLLNDVDVYRRFTILPATAKTAFLAKEYSSAKIHAEELLNLAPKYSDDWNYGNAIHDGNMVLGRLAVNSGDLQKGIEHLIAAGKTPGSPQLNSFGPNMSLASDLLEKGEQESVIAYFGLCKKFWRLEDGRLDSWAASIRGGGKPYFGVQLLY